MYDINEEQINCVFQTQNQVAIFDKDNWVTTDSTKDNIISQQIPINQNKQQCDPQLIKKIDIQLENSKQNFFKVKITKGQHKKQGNINVKSLKKIEASIGKNPNLILKQGYMQKKTDSFFFTWKSRYFALTSQKLFFFQNNKRQKTIGCINFKLMPVELKKIQKNQFILDFMGESENFILKCQNQQQELNEWITLIQQVIKFQSKQKKLLLKTFIKPLYNCQDSITQKQFTKIAQTGDILLFYTRNTGAKIQRMITNSDFDHVGMVIKFGNNQTMVFESNQAYGVSIYDWNQYIKYFNLYDKVTLRKLNSSRKSELHHSFLNFVKKNLGKKYDINAMKFLKLESDFNWQQVKQDQTRGFFCSQLIAKAYKTVGLIEQKKYSGRYWPVDFSQKAEMILKNGSYLGHQQSIILDRHVKNML